MLNNKNNNNNNTSGKNFGEEIKIWLERDGIVRIETGKTINDETAEIIVRKFQEVAKGMTEKPRVLVNITHLPHSASSSFRKKVVDLLKEALKTPGVSKAAIYGGGPIQKIVVSFVLGVVRVKNIKYFKTEEEALKWLKEN